MAAKTQSELEAENRRLREQLAALEAKGSRSTETRERIVAALAEAAAERGHAVELRDVIERVGIGNSTFYKYFVSRNEAIQELAKIIVRQTFDESRAIYAFDNSYEALRSWMKHGFDQVERYGELAVELCFPDMLPPWLRPIATNDEMYRFTGYLIRKAQEDHYLRETSVRASVRTWFSMCHPGRFQACMRDGLSWDEVSRETFDVFMMAYGKR